MVELKGTKKQVKWAEDIRKEVIKMNNFLLENVNVLEEDAWIEKAKTRYTNSKEYLENVNSAAAYINNFKDILTVEGSCFERDVFYNKFRVFKQGLKNLELQSYTRLGITIKNIMEEKGK